MSSLLPLIKANFEGDFDKALEAFKTIASPMSLALIEWALEQPKTVYALSFQGASDDYYVEGIYATEEAAQAALEKQPKQYQKYFWVEPREIEHG